MLVLREGRLTYNFRFGSFLSPSPPPKKKRKNRRAVSWMPLGSMQAWGEHHPSPWSPCKGGSPLVEMNHRLQPSIFRGKLAVSFREGNWIERVTLKVFKLYFSLGPVPIECGEYCLSDKAFCPQPIVADLLHGDFWWMIPPNGSKWHWKSWWENPVLACV